MTQAVGAIWAQTWRSWVHAHAPAFKEAGSERCVFIKREHARGHVVAPFARVADFCFMFFSLS